MFNAIETNLLVSRKFQRMRFDLHSPTHLKFIVWPSIDSENFPFSASSQTHMFKASNIVIDSIKLRVYFLRHSNRNDRTTNAIFYLFIYLCLLIQSTLHISNTVVKCCPIIWNMLFSVSDASWALSCRSIGRPFIYQFFHRFGMISTNANERIWFRAIDWGWWKIE